MKKIYKIVAVVLAVSTLGLVGCDAGVGGLDRDNKSKCGFVCVNV